MSPSVKEKTKVKCPFCGSLDIKEIPTYRIKVGGLIKVAGIFTCLKCKKDFSEETVTIRKIKSKQITQKR